MCKNSYHFFIILFFEFIQIMLAGAAETETDGASDTTRLRSMNLSLYCIAYGP